LGVAGNDYNQVAR